MNIKYLLRKIENFFIKKNLIIQKQLLIMLIIIKKLRFYHSQVLVGQEIYSKK